MLSFSLCLNSLQGHNFKQYIFKFIYVIYFWLHWVFTAAHRLSLVVAIGGYSLRCGARALGVRASVVVARRLSSCGSPA